MASASHSLLNLSKLKSKHIEIQTLEVLISFASESYLSEFDNVSVQIRKTIFSELVWLLVVA